MNALRTLSLLGSALVAILACAAENPQDVFASKRASEDVLADPNPDSPFWRAAPAVFATADTMGTEVPGHRTEIRSRWTPDNLYLLFICPYQQLYLKPNPVVKQETNELWNWDVAEAFIGSDFQNIRRYKEFEISPQGEWVDLDIDLSQTHRQDAWLWNSGFQAAARIDASAHVWYGVMRIPFASIDTRPAAAGRELRINLYRAQGPPSAHKAIAWQPTGRRTYHAPESFAILRLVD